MALFTAVSKDNFDTALSEKQDKLTAGNNIKINSNGYISSNFSSGSWTNIGSWTSSYRCLINYISSYSQFLIVGNAYTTTTATSATGLYFTINSTSYLIASSFFTTTRRYYYCHFVYNGKAIQPITINYGTSSNALTSGIIGYSVYPVTSTTISKFTSINLGSSSYSISGSLTIYAR